VISESEIGKRQDGLSEAKPMRDQKSEPQQEPVVSESEIGKR